MTKIFDGERYNTQDRFHESLYGDTTCETLTAQDVSRKSPSANMVLEAIVHFSIINAETPSRLFSEIQIALMDYCDETGIDY